MASKRAIERRLADLDGFENPRVEREQYTTPADLAAHLVHLAALHGDLSDRTVVDLGTGTGMLAIGAVLAGAERVVGLDVDREALETARKNQRWVVPDMSIEWVLGDATDSPLRSMDSTVLMNPPFGAQVGHEHADRAFLATAAEIASVSYSIHNDGSESFVESFAADNGGTVTHAYRGRFALPRQFDFHERDSKEIDVEVYRIEWKRDVTALQR